MLQGSEQRSFETLVAQFEKLYPGISKDKILTLVEEKKNKVGGGYLTDQGALFLVASEMGVTLNHSQESPKIRIADLTIDLQNVDIEGTVLAYGLAKSFTRKTDSKTGLIAKLIIYDDTSTVGVSLWDSKALLLASTELSPGDQITIKNAYARKGIDGALGLNIAEKGTLERKDGQTSRLEEKSIAIEFVQEGAKYLVVKGTIKTRPKQSSFTRSDGSSGTITSFSLGSGSDPERDMRVVIWENSNPVFQNLSVGEKITIVNVRSRMAKPFGDQTGAETIELHGDDTTCVLEYWKETMHWLKKNSASIESISSAHDKSHKKDPIPFIARILSMGSRSSDGSTLRLLLVDSQKRKFSATITKDAISDCDNLKMDELIVCKPDSIDYIGLKLGCSKRGSLSKVNSNRPDIPNSSSLVTKVENLSEGSIASIEVMSLSESISREVQTKDGLVRRTELLVGDPTGEIRLYAWRELSKLLEKLPAGERMWLRSIEVQSHEGRKFLNFRNYSKIERNV